MGISNMAKQLIKDAFQRGYVDAVEGKQSSDNPYTICDIDRYCDWLDGYTNALKDIKLREEAKLRRKSHIKVVKEFADVLFIISLYLIIFLVLKHSLSS